MRREKERRKACKGARQKNRTTKTCLLVSPPAAARRGRESKSTSALLLGSTCVCPPSPARRAATLLRSSLPRSSGCRNGEADYCPIIPQSQTPSSAFRIYVDRKVNLLSEALCTPTNPTISFRRRCEVHFYAYVFTRASPPQQHNQQWAHYKERMGI